MCENCKGFNEVIKFNRPDEYLNLIAQIKELINQKVFRLIKGNCELEKINKNSQWPEDFLEHQFGCTKCKQTFELSCETYHGNGGSWKPIKS